MKRIAILGSTGSIGRNALEVIRHLPAEFEVIGLSTNSNIDILAGQIKKFSPKVVAVRDSLSALRLKRKLNNRIKLLVGDEAAAEIAQEGRVDLVLLAISGSGALVPLIKAVEAGKDVALANKEALVMAGEIIMQKARLAHARILPVDSEQSAIWQCIDGKEKKALKKIYLTASGGPFFGLPPMRLKKISLRQVLRHPRWKMGRKVTVDSATLMNKGLELIESMRLFGLKPKQIEILIHPQAIIHSMAEFIDGSILAQLSVTDMRIPIQYALTYPKRCPSRLTKINFFKLEKLSFYQPDLKRFPCLGLAWEAARGAGSLPCVLNAANEIAVEAFLKGKVGFLAIPQIIEKVLSKHRVILNPQLPDIFYSDAWARQQAEELTYRFARG